MDATSSNAMLKLGVLEHQVQLRVAQVSSTCRLSQLPHIRKKYFAALIRGAQLNLQFTLKITLKTEHEQSLQCGAALTDV